MNIINETYINALLADAAYVQLKGLVTPTNPNPTLLSETDQKAAIAARLT